MKCGYLMYIKLKFKKFILVVTRILENASVLFCYSPLFFLYKRKSQHKHCILYFMNYKVPYKMKQISVHASI